MVISDPVDVLDLPHVFPQIEPYITRLHLEFEGDPAWLIYESLELGQTSLHVVEGEGFAILMIDDDRSCFVVSMAAIDGVTIRSIYVIISNAIEWLKQHHCPHLSFRSPRKGWDKVAKRLGFTKTDDLFERKL